MYIHTSDILLVLIKIQMIVGIRSCVWEAFDYMAGRNLLADIMLNGLLPERLGRSHTVQLCEGLLYLDFKHVVHRYMKPENHGRLSY